MHCLLPLLLRSCAIVLAALLVPHASAAVIGVCPADVALAPELVRRQELAGEGGARILVVADLATQLPQDCVVSNVDVPAAAVRWVSALGADAPPDAASLTVIGRFDDAPWQLSEVIFPTPEPTAQAAAPVPPLMPYAENMLPYFMPQVFGSEERASFDSDGTLVCAAGAAPAGVVLHATRRWQGRTRMDLVLELEGSGQFDLGVADAADQQLESPRRLSTLDLPGDAPSGALRVALPEQDTNWVSLTLACPPGAARVQLRELRLETADVPMVHHRAAWLWQPELWLRTPEEALRIARTESLQRVYITIPVDSTGAVANAQDLAVFVSSMRGIGTQVWAVLGDPRDVLEENRAMLQRRVQAYLAYNAATPDAPVAGLQLDIEPYLLPGFDQQDAAWRARYLATITDVQRLLGTALPLDLVVPVWWGDHPLWGRPLFDALQHEALSLTVMNYRTQPGPLRTGAQPFLTWGQDSGVLISIALELGSVGEDLTRLNFARSTNAGSLWLLPVADTRLLVLLDAAHEPENGTAYREVARGVVASSNVSFGGDHERLWQLLEILQAEWSAWPSFQGVAIHGFDELYADGKD